jgi:hypothetical protein
VIRRRGPTAAELAARLDRLEARQSTTGRAQDEFNRMTAAELDHYLANYVSPFQDDPAYIARLAEIKTMSEPELDQMLRQFSLDPSQRARAG